MTDFNRNTNPQIQPRAMRYSLHLTITTIYRRPASLLWVLFFSVCFSIHLVLANDKGSAGSWALASISGTHICAGISSGVSPIAWAEDKRRLAHFNSFQTAKCFRKLGSIFHLFSSIYSWSAVISVVRPCEVSVQRPRFKNLLGINK